MTRILALAIILISSSMAAQGQSLVSEISAHSVEISSGFDGEKISIYGTVESDSLTTNAATGRLDVVVAIVGPTQPRVTRFKTHNFGLWLNTEQVEYPELPGYFHVLSSARLGAVAEPDLLLNNQLLPEAFGYTSALGSAEHLSQFAAETIRILSEKGLFGQTNYGVQFLSDTLFSAQFQLPSDAPPGAYVVRIFAFRDGQAIARNSKGFTVRKVALERFVDQSAQQSPLLYGLFCVALAVLTGWLGGVLFRR